MDELDNIDFNLCKSFLAVAKTGSISRAANMLYVSQPAVSYNIKILEDKLSCKLFNRTTKGVELTAEAQKLLYYIENAYNTIKMGFKLLNDSSDLLSGEIRIGVPTHICIFFISDIIEIFNKNYPGIKFSILNRATAEMVDMLEKRQLDLIIDSYPIESARDDIVLENLLEVDNCFVASNKYNELVKKNEKINIEELSKYPLLLQQEKTSTRQALENIKNKYEEKFKPTIEVATTEVMLELVKKGLGIGYFAQMSVLQELRAGTLIEIPIKEELPKTKICIVYIKEFLTNAPKRFIQEVKQKAECINALKEKSIRLILTQSCTYNCNFCHKEGIVGNREDKLSPEDIAYMYGVLNNTYGIKTIHLTGGEPLLNSNIQKICEQLKEKGAIVKMTTNAYLLKDNFWIGKSIDKLNVSLHSLQKEIYENISGMPNSLEKVIKSIKELRFKYPTLKICINVTLLKNVNDKLEDIEELVKFANSIKADLKIVELYPESSNKFVPIQNIISKIKKLGYKEISNDFRKKTFYNNNQNIILQKCTCSAVKEIDDKTKTCKLNNDIYITQDGKINLCRHSTEIINLYDDIVNRNDEVIVKNIKKAYEKMGNNCKC